MASFSVLILTAPPPGLSGEGSWMTKVDGREAILRTVEQFLNRDKIKQILVVVDAGAMEEVKRKLGGHFSFSGVKLATGGPRWVDQMSAGAEKLAAEATHVLVHDAARATVPYSDIDAILEESEKKPIVALTTPLKASLVEVDEGGNALAVHSPASYQQILTPVGYAREKFLELAKAKKEPHASEITLLQGSSLNVRLTGGDASLVKAMINLLPKPKIKGPLTPFDEAQW